MSEAYKHQQAAKNKWPCYKFEDYECKCGYCHDCGWLKTEHRPTPEPLSPSPEIRYQLRNWHHVTCAGFGGQACTCLAQREALIAELAYRPEIVHGKEEK